SECSARSLSQGPSFSDRFLFPSRHPIDDPATLHVLHLRIEAVFAFAPEAMLLQPLAQIRNQGPITGVDFFSELRAAFGTRRKWEGRVRENVAQERGKPRKLIGTRNLGRLCPGDNPLNDAVRESSHELSTAWNRLGGSCNLVRCLNGLVQSIFREIVRAP